MNQPSTPAISTESPHAASTAPLTRDALIALLGPDDVANIRAAEAAASLEEGEEYLDLNHLEHGVRRVSDHTASVTNVLPKRAISERVWQMLLAQTPQQQHAKALAAKLEESGRQSSR